MVSKNMFDIALKNGKTFICDESFTILEAAKKAGIVLEHSCLSARCRSCIAKVVSGQTEDIEEDFILSKEEKRKGFVLSCNVKPLSNLSLDLEDLGGLILSKSRTIPCKINHIEMVSSDIIKLVLRLPPNSNFKFLAGQYVNLIKGNISRSYSIANCQNMNSTLEFFIKNYDDGIMSYYWFNKAKIDDVLRLKGPLGTFFLRDKPKKDIIFMATGTGIAPIKSILESLNKKDFHNSKITVIWGVRHEESLFLDSVPFKGADFHKVISRPTSKWKGFTGYVQDVLLLLKSNLSDSVVYACGSNEMIKSSKKLLIEKGLRESDFYSDAFVSSN